MTSSKLLDWVSLPPRPCRQPVLLSKRRLGKSDSLACRVCQPGFMSQMNPLPNKTQLREITTTGSKSSRLKNWHCVRTDRSRPCDEQAYACACGTWGDRVVALRGFRSLGLHRAMALTVISPFRV